MDRRGPGHSAPYGQACMHCFKSKCRCVARPDGDGCERCHRLNRQCRPSDSARKRNTQNQNNSNSNTRLSEVEGKLDGLLSLLQTVFKSPDSSDVLRGALVDPDSSHDSGSGADKSNSTPTNGTGTSTGTDESSGGGISANSTAASPLTGLSSCSPPILDGGGGGATFTTTSTTTEPSAREADAALDLFRSQMLPYFALVHLPPHLTAQQLRRNRPFLFRAIVAVASPTQQRRARGRELKRILTHDAVLENQSSMDLLLGVLVYTAWGHDQYTNRSGTLSRLMMLAMSLVYDMRLHKPLPPDTHMIGAYAGFKCNSDATEDTFECKRALLGCYLLSSAVSDYFTQIDALRWTPRMEEALRAVAASRECPTDEAFAFQVRTQLLAQRAVNVREQREMDQALAADQPSAAAAAHVPLFLYFKTLQSQPRELLGRLSPELQQEKFLLLHMHAVELCVSETAHTANADHTPSHTNSSGNNHGSGGTRPESNTSITTHKMERLECLWRSVHAIKGWLDVFFTMSPGDYALMPFGFGAQLARCLVTLCRLSVLQDPAWDRQAVRATVDVVAVLDRIGDMLGLLTSNSEDTMFSGFLVVIRMFRAWTASKLAVPPLTSSGPGAGPGSLASSGEGEVWSATGTGMGYDGSGGGSGSGGMVVDEAMLDLNQMAVMQEIDLLNDRWLDDFFGGQGGFGS
ncbi:hypothetical protein QBC47DRAFT_294045 [Echria macrotheca]|uniref:Zn(2)-C6 fungal-type domain-containing protein n=1 Tax=Echria macrotheca TaxID=438768 RepID=A0AAJ0BPS2_9PEZI|nr:hypothetical protein QBC47DRAFT_294045 [Echria macrotheca]